RAVMPLIPAGTPRATRTLSCNFSRISMATSLPEIFAHREAFRRLRRATKNSCSAKRSRKARRSEPGSLSEHRRYLFFLDIGGRREIPPLRDGKNGRPSGPFDSAQGRRNDSFLLPRDQAEPDL